MSETKKVDEDPVTSQSSATIQKVEVGLVALYSLSGRFTFSHHRSTSVFPILKLRKSLFEKFNQLGPCVLELEQSQ